MLQLALHDAQLPRDEAGEAQKLPEEQVASLMSAQLRESTSVVRGIEVLVTLGAIGLVSTLGVRLWKRLTM